jgi:uncharacterized protein YrrD
MDNIQATRKWSEIDGLAVVSLADGKKIGTVDDFYFDPTNSKIYALRMKTGLFGHKVIQVATISSIGQDAITIPNEEKLYSESEDPKLPAFFSGRNLLTYKIMSASGNVIGTTGNVLLDISVPTALRIAAFELSGGLGDHISGRFPTFSSSQVVRYGQDVLVVPDEVVQTLH